MKKVGTKKKAGKAGTSKEAAAQRRALFVEAYVTNGGNGSEAAIKAGFAARSARVTASQLRTDPNIAAAIDKRKAEVVERVKEKTGITKEWVTERLRVVAERCLQAEPVLDRKGLPVLVETPGGEIAPAFEFNSMGANRALELLGKELGMFVDRKEVGDPGAFDKLDDDELLNAAAEAERVIATARGPAGADRSNPNRSRNRAAKSKA